jgi:putative phage-type endonuclease
MNDADFHARRLTGLGGSDSPAALGISPWRTPYELWVEKTGQGSPVAESEPMLWGTLHEPIIRAEYIRRTGRAVLVQSEMLRHDKYTWMIAHLDGRALDRILEIKTSRDGRGWGEPGTDEIPLHYGAQVHHCLVVTGAEICDLAVLIGGNELRIYTIHADPVIADELIGREAEFWQRVEQNNPPDPVNLDDARARWGHLLIESSVRAGAEELAAIEVMHRARAERAKIEAEEAEAKLLLMQALRDRGDTLVDENGTRLCTWALDKGRKAFTVEAREPARRFLLKG